MPHRIIFTPDAEANLSTLYDYIADNASLARAGDFVGRIEAACMALSEFPLRGIARPDLGVGLRTLAFERRAVIVYSVDSDLVRIVRIHYAGRDYENNLATN